MNAGYYEATTLNPTGSPLQSSNIKKGAIIFGIPGDVNVVDTTTTDNAATAADIALGKKAWVNGIEVVGANPFDAPFTNSFGMTFNLIHSGTFTMGSPDGTTEFPIGSGQIPQ